GGAGVVSYFLADQNFVPAMHGAYYPYPKSVWIHDNTLTGNGTMPDTANPLGVILKGSPFPGGVVTAVMYDGLVDSAVTGTRPGNPMDICVSGNVSSTFANLHADVSPPFSGLTTDATNYTCMLTPLPPVSFPGAN